MQSKKQEPKQTINLIIWNEHQGGIEKILMNYPMNLDRFDFNVFVLRPNTSGIDMYQAAYLKSKTYGNASNRKLFPDFYKYARNHRNEIFHVLSAGPVILSILKLAGCKRIVYHIHGTIYWKKKYLKTPIRALWRFSLSKTVKIASNSKYSRSMFLERANGQYPVQVIYNPFTIPGREEVALKRQWDDLRIFFVGRLARGKNLYLWLDIAKKLSHEFDNISFHLYGKGPYEESLKEYAKKLGISKQVSFHGFLQNIEESYKNNDLLMFLSEYESFGNVVVESVLYETPVLAKPIPAMQEIFEGYPDFLLDESKEYADQVIEKIKSIDKLRKTAKEANNDFREKFSLQSHLKQFENLYERS